MSEEDYKQWLGGISAKTGVDYNPNDPLYDYRGAYKAGTIPTWQEEHQQYRWPDQFKAKNYNQVIDHATGRRKMADEDLEKIPQEVKPIITRFSDAVKSTIEKASGWNPENVPRNTTAEFDASVKNYNPNKGILTRSETYAPGPGLAERGWLGTKPGEAPTTGIFSKKSASSTAVLPPAASPTPAGYPTESEKRFGGGAFGGAYEGDIAIPSEAAPTNVLPWRNQNLPGGGKQYTLENGEGTMTLPANWNASAEGKKFLGNFDRYSTSAGAIRANEEALNPKQDITYENLGPNQIARFKGGIPSRSDTERAQWGGMEAPEKKEFDYKEFSKVVSSIGGNVPIPMRAKIFEQMSKGIEEHNARVDEFQKLRMQVGAGSPQMITAQSAARTRDIESQIAAAKSGPEIQNIMSQAIKNQAEVAGMPARNEHELALAGYYRAITENPQYRHMKDEADTYMKAYAAEFDPARKDILLQGAVQSLSGGMASANAYGGYIAQLKQKDPSLNLPPVPPPIGTVIEVKPGTKRRWNGTVYEKVV